MSTNTAYLRPEQVPTPALPTLIFATSHEDAYRQVMAFCDQILDEIDQHVPRGHERPGGHYMMRAGLVKAREGAQWAANTKDLDTRLEALRHGSK